MVGKCEKCEAEMDQARTSASRQASMVALANYWQSDVHSCAGHICISYHRFESSNPSSQLATTLRETY